MKKLNVKWIALAFAALVGITLAGCKHDPSDTPTPEPEDTRTYLENGAEITLNVGETKTVYVKDKTQVDEFNCPGLTITSKGDSTFEVVSAETMTDASVNVNFNDGTEEDEGISATVYVYDPYYTLNISLSEEVAAEAASISVYAEGKEDSESTASLTQTVDAVYTAGEKSATAKLAKDKANSYDYFNNIVVTVKNADDDVIETEATPVCFCYSDDNFSGIAVSAAKSSKVFSINFEGFTVVGGSVSGLRYSTVWKASSAGWESDTTVEPSVTVSDDGTKATFEVAQTKEFYIDWTAVVVKDSDDKEISISAGNTEANKWYGYSDTKWSNTLTHVSGTYVNICSAKEFTADAGYYKVLEPEVFSELKISTLKIVVKLTSATEYWASASSADSWVDSTYQSLPWNDSDEGYSAVITSPDFISALSTNGLYLDTKDGVGTVTVDYIAE